MSRKMAITLITFWAISVFSIGQVFGQTHEIGVSIGDWFTYRVEFFGNQTYIDENSGGLQYWTFVNSCESVKLTIIEAAKQVITYIHTYRFENGTELEKGFGSLNISDGYSEGASILFVGAGLDVNDPIPFDVLTTINGTFSQTFSEGEREIIYANRTTSEFTAEAQWDRITGVPIKLSQTVYGSPDDLLNLEVVLIDSNLPEIPEYTTFFSLPLLCLIVTSIIVYIKTRA